MLDLWPKSIRYQETDCLFVLIHPFVFGLSIKIHPPSTASQLLLFNNIGGSKCNSDWCGGGCVSRVARHCLTLSDVQMFAADIWSCNPNSVFCYHPFPGCHQRNTLLQFVTRQAFQPSDNVDCIVLPFFEAFGRRWKFKLSGFTLILQVWPIHVSKFQEYSCPIPLWSHF